MSRRWHVIGSAAVAAMLGLSPLPARAAAPATADSLWDAEGRTLRDLVSVTGDEARGEALFRLGQWERDSAERVRKTEARTEQAAQLHLDAAERAFQSAIPLAAEERLPQVLFSLGDVRRLRGNPAGAHAPFARLVHDFPDDALAVDASIALGDDAFDAARLAEAVQRFEFADKHATAGGSRAYARYKLAWCHLNLEEMETARFLFLDVVRLATADGQKLSLADEARRDFVLALARDPKVSAAEADAAIKGLKLPEDRTRRYIEGYANIIAGAGRDEEAARLFVSLEGHAPAADAIRILTAQLEIAVRQRNLAVSVATGNKLGNTLGAFPGSEDSRREAEKALRVAAVTLHGEGRARGDQPTLQAALSLYTAYFLAFDESPLAYELHHHAGELLDMLHQPARAERHYSAAVVRDLKAMREHKAPGKWLAASALGAVNMAQDAMPVLARPPKLAAPEDADADRPPPRVTPLSDPERIFVAACDRFIEALGRDPQAVSIAYQRALLLYRHNEFEEAGAQLEKIALEHPGDQKAQFAAELALDALQVRGQYDALAALAHRFAAVKELAAALGSELRDVHQAALLAAAHRESREGRHREAGQRYLRFASSFPDSSRIELALFNAAAELTMQGRLNEAVATRSRLLRNHGASDLSRRARQQQLTDLVHLGRFPEAAPLAAILASDPKAEEAATRLHDAITVTEAAGDIRGADALRQRYLREFHRGPDAMGCALSLVDHARGCETQTKAGREALALAPDVAWRVIALDRLAQTEARCHVEGAARAHASTAVVLAPRLPANRPDALDAVASAQLLLVASDADRYRKLEVTPPYERTLPKKLAALKALDERLAKVIAHGRAGAAVCALVQAGSAYGELANMLSNAKAPRSFTTEQRELFHEQLTDKSQPLLDHARETLMQAITRAREARTDPLCLGQARKELVALWPERFGQRQEAVARLEGAPSEVGSATAAAILAKAPDAPAAWLMAARAELLGHRPQASFVLADRVLPGDFLFEQGLEIKAEALDALGRSDAALGLWSKLAEEFAERPLAHRVLADRAMASRDFEGARTHLEALRKTETKNPDIALNLGVALHALGDLKGAEQALRDAAGLDPKKLEASLDLGLLLCGDAGRPKEGIEMLERFHQSGGSAPDAHGFEAALGACRALAAGGRP